jgi:hypothetical protein
VFDGWVALVSRAVEVQQTCRDEAFHSYRLVLNHWLLEYLHNQSLLKDDQVNHR